MKERVKGGYNSDGISTNVLCLPKCYIMLKDETCHFHCPKIKSFFNPKMLILFLAVHDINGCGTHWNQL